MLPRHSLTGRASRLAAYSTLLKYRTMASAVRTYDDAIRSLNSLQSNFAVLDAVRKSGKMMNDQAIPEMVAWARRVGYNPSDFNRLNIIHVAGTKGKGSTCAFASSILSEYRRAGVLQKTGLYTSPHLRAVRERIQINGEPISEETFAKYFFEVWDRIEESAKTEGLDRADKPAYFRFLTLMAFHTYMREGVDTAIFEVGVGGEYDSTNIIQNPTATGITSLGIDHVGVLGNTIESIAWNKAGIFKNGSPGFTVDQPPSAMEVLKQRAEEKGTSLQLVRVHPEIQNGAVQLGLKADFQLGNASLAVALVEAHLKALGHPVNVSSEAPLPEGFKRGLQNVEWAGRCQVIQQANIEWNIDGAHTMESLDAAGKWFADKLDKPRKRVLIFNQQKRDAPENLLGALAASLKRQIADADSLFDHAMFCTNITWKEQGYKPDLMSVGSDTAAVTALTVQKALASAWHDADQKAQTHVLKTVEEAVDMVRSLEGDVQVLVTGSLHLVGGFLEVLDPQT
ncbi:putative tetrahydrofolylpolyglutamate synthase [Sphaerosporella brunnea]|uniref:Folylpolyglutamate synthase n=1 Tax=Sphaerosporella brunnea TaxID=1250544 RepID=A0A5J5F2A5_9PEZI|nr:putative tetrahydrofolylpolyglutamate synthase [Sphaerosporella brunnea]